MSLRSRAIYWTRIVAMWATLYAGVYFWIVAALWGWAECGWLGAVGGGAIAMVPLVALTGLAVEKIGPAPRTKQRESAG